MRYKLKNIIGISCVMAFLAINTTVSGQSTTSPASPVKAVPDKLSPSAGIPATGTDVSKTTSEGVVPDKDLKISPDPADGKKETEKEVEADAEKEKLQEYSAFQKYIMDRISPEVSRQVDHFGYSFFQSVPETFTPAQAIPVNTGYVIGPDDEIRVNVWGMVEGIWNLVVDRDGNIDIPTVGTLSVAGLTYGNLQPFLKKELSKYYKEFHINVSMGKLRNIPVYLVGNVKKPGSYSVSSLSTLVNALFVSGGPSTSGSMRDISLKRQGKTVVRFDMYDFLLNGDKTKDVRLEPEDVIFVPPAGSLVAIIGNVTNPAIYEIKGDASLKELIDMSGGVTATGYIKRLQVERIFENETRIILDKNISELSADKDGMKLLNGDIVVIYPVPDKITNAVTLKGNVVRPGDYQWFEGIKLSDIIKNPEKDLLPETNFEYGLIERLLLPSYEKELIFFNPRKAFIEKNSEEDKLLQPYDTVEIFYRWQYEEQKKLKIAGAVAVPGTYAYTEKARVSDLIKQAGGLTDLAYTREAELTRVIPTPEGLQTERFYLNIERALQNDPQHNILLAYNDYLFVRPIPGGNLYETAEIKGEVKFPGIYSIMKGETITSLIARAGGFTDDAYVRGAVFTRKEVRDAQRKQMDKMIEQLELDLLTPSKLEDDSSTSDMQKLEAEMEKKRELVAKLKEIQPDGRIVISLAQKPGTKTYDMALQDGDVLAIPKNPNIVSVLGSVYNPTSFVYGKKLSYTNYLKMAGGATPSANRRELYIIKADGSMVKPGRGYRLEPGDAVVVPEKLEFVSGRRQVLDMIDILYRAAMVVVVTSTAF
ncbi:MAG TPA: SLBB domain-containing protein [bacterium]|nr:SLBB domain-containing protein [bacterium]